MRRICLLVLFLMGMTQSALRPNILFILVDDMGIGDVKAFNPDAKTTTPNLDKLATEGMKFTDAHVPGSSCITSRYGLLTGRYPFRASSLKWQTEPLIEANRWTMATVLQRNGYKTGMVGKWHLGFNYSDFNNLTGGPVDRGFDYYFGISRSLDQADYYYIENKAATQPPTGNVAASAGYGTNGWQGPFWRAGKIGSDFKHDEVLGKFTQKSIEYIQTHSAGSDTTPFFLYTALASPHTPWLASAQYKGTSPIGDWGDWVAENDAMIGSIIQAVYDNGVKDNTLIFFTSDNGPVWWPEDIVTFDHRATSIYKGKKFDAWEGGHRMPFIASWPGVIEKSSTSNQIISTTDMLATFAALVGEIIPNNWAEDSYNIWDALLDANLSTPVRGAFVGRPDNTGLFIRQGDWKLINGNQLYNLVTDPSETTNVFAQNSAIASQLANLLSQYQSDGRSIPTTRLNPITLLGCMDSNYLDYDPTATHQPDNACINLPIGKKVNGDYFPQIQIQGTFIKVFNPGPYHLIITNIKGEKVFSSRGYGSKTYSRIMGPTGIYTIILSNSKNTLSRAFYQL